MITRRDFLKLAGINTLALYAAARGNPLMRVLAAPASPGLSDPATSTEVCYSSAGCLISRVYLSTR